MEPGWLASQGTFRLKWQQYFIFLTNKEILLQEKEIQTPNHYQLATLFQGSLKTVPVDISVTTPSQKNNFLSIFTRFKNKNNDRIFHFQKPMLPFDEFSLNK